MSNVKNPLSLCRDVLIDQMKMMDVDLLNVDDEARYRYNALPYFTFFQAKDWVMAYPDLCQKEPLHTLFQSVNPILYADLQLNDAPCETLLNVTDRFFDMTSDFDGVDEHTFLKGLNEGATLETIKALALSYGLTMPRRLKKKELIDIICKRSNGKATQEMLSTMTVFDLEAYAKKHQYYVSIELKKMDMIYYLLDYLKGRQKAQTPHQNQLRDTSLILDLTTQEFLSRSTPLRYGKWVLVILSFMVLSGLIFMRLLG